MRLCLKKNQLIYFRTLMTKFLCNTLHISFVVCFCKINQIVISKILSLCMIDIFLYIYINKCVLILLIINYRWMEVIGSATQHASRMRLFSRKDSDNNYSDVIVK